MTPETLLAFTLAYMLAVAVPGPFVAAMIARSMAQGFGVGFAMNLGAGLGDLVWASCALFGLSLIADVAAPVLAGLKYAGAAYIVWIGVRMLTARAHRIEALQTETSTRPLRNILTGLALTLGNPKPMAFFLAVMPGLFDLARLTPGEKAVILLIIPPLLMSVLCTWAAMAVRARSMLRDAQAVQRMNRVTGGVMVGAGVAIAAG